MDTGDRYASIVLLHIIVCKQRFYLACAIISDFEVHALQALASAKVALACCTREHGPVAMPTVFTELSWPITAAASVLLVVALIIWQRATLSKPKLS